MTEMNFKDEDKERLIGFLNTIAKHATFKVDTMELIKYFKDLSYIQNIILPKIGANILEIKELIQPNKKDNSEG